MSSHDSHDSPEDREPIILTTPSRFGKGLVMIIITLAVGAAILIPFWDEMFEVPPPVTQIRADAPAVEEDEEQPPAEEGVINIAMLEGSAVQGNPAYAPDPAEVPVDSSIIWDNEDTVPHTSTSGTGPDDPASGQLFDTGIINGGESSDPIELTDVAEGDTIPYYCIVHPYMVGELTVVGALPADAAAPTGQEEATDGEAATTAAGPTLIILEGSAVQGNPDYDPEELTVSVGDEITVVNEDTVPHTVTSGTGPQDETSGQAFDTGILDVGASDTLSFADVAPGEYDYYCIVHPYMMGKIIVQ